MGKILKKQYEFVLEETGDAFEGISPLDVFSKLPDDFFGGGLTPKVKARMCFAKNKIDEPVPDVIDKNKFYLDFFEILQKKLVGTWRWFNGEIGQYWRYGGAILVRRKNNGMGKRCISQDAIEKWRSNIQRANSVLLGDREKKLAACSKGGKKGSKAFLSMTPEVRAKMEERKKEGIRKFWASLSDEERRVIVMSRLEKSKRNGQYVHSQEFLEKKRLRDEARAAMRLLPKQRKKYTHTREWLEKKASESAKPKRKRGRPRKDGK